MVSSSWFRRHQKTVYIIMIFSMCVWGVSYSAMEMIPKKPIGKIYGKKITQNEFVDMLGRWQRLFFSRANDSVVSLVWKQLVKVEEAKRMGLVVTGQEVEEGLVQLAFQIFGGRSNIDQAGLMQFLCSNFKLNQEQIERTLMEALLVEKLESLMLASVKASTEEVWQRYAMENEQVKCKVITLKAEDYVNSVNIGEDEINTYYEKYKNDEYVADSDKPGYKLPERVKLECIIAKYDDIEKQSPVSEDEMKKYYDDNKETRFKIAEEESKPGDGKKDDTVITKDAASPDSKPSGEDDGDAAKQKGNQQEKKVPAYKSFAEVKKEIQKTLAREKAIEKGTEIMNKLDEEIYETMDKAERPSFKDLANKYKLTYDIPKSKKSGDAYLIEADFGELFPGSDQISRNAFERGEGEPSVPFHYVEGKVIFQVVEKKLSAAAPLEEVRSKVIHDLKREKSLIKAKGNAEKFAGMAGDKGFDTIVNAMKQESGGGNVLVCETDYISRPMKLFDKDSRYIEALKGDRPNVAKKAFELKPGQIGIAAEPSGETACYILSLIDKKPADKASFEKDKENITKRYLYEKQEAFLAAWQNDLGQNVEIYTKFQ